MKYHSGFIALGSIGCALLLLGSRTSSLAASSADDLEKAKHSEEAKKRKVSKYRTVEQAPHDGAKIAKRDEDLAAKQHHATQEGGRHDDELRKHQGEPRLTRQNDQSGSTHHDNIGHGDNFHEHRKHDHYTSHGERDALIGTGVAVGISALHELSKPKETVYNGVPLTAEKPAKTAKHADKSEKATSNDVWSQINPVRKDLPAGTSSDPSATVAAPAQP